MSTCFAKAPEASAPSAPQVIELFDRLFEDTEQTVLRGGAEEPLYEPANVAPDISHRSSAPAVIHFRHDYVASAFHEVAHWCIAGRERRTQRDYGYWYAPDGRSRQQQAVFFSVEARPQALEWCFAQAAGIPFHLSIDNLDGETDPADKHRFAQAVLESILAYCDQGLPERAHRFFAGLTTLYPSGVALGDLRTQAVDQFS